MSLLQLAQAWDTVSGDMYGMPIDQPELLTGAEKDAVVQLGLDVARQLRGLLEDILPDPIQ